MHIHFQDRFWWIVLPTLTLLCPSVLSTTLAQTATTRATASSPVGNVAVSKDLSSSYFSRELNKLTQQLRAQERQIEQQATWIEELQHGRHAGDSSSQRSHRMANSARFALGHPSLTRPSPNTSPPLATPVDHGILESSPFLPDCRTPTPWFRIGGQYRLMFNSANFGFHEPTVTDAQQSETFFNQRFRTWVEVHPNDQVSGYVQVEMGHILWGRNCEFPKSYPDGASSLTGDRIGVELRRGYLTYQDGESGVFRVGIQDWHDAFGESYTLGSEGAVDDYDSFGAVLANSVWDFNVGGLSYSGTTLLSDRVNVNAGAFVLWEGATQEPDEAFLVTLDLDRAISNDRSIGFSAYYLSDQGGYSYPIVLPDGSPFAYRSSWDLWMGLRANTLLGSVPIRGFAIYNTGERNDVGGTPRFHHDGVALKLEAGALTFGPGKLHFQTLYSTGAGQREESQRNGFRTIAQSARDNDGAQGYWSYLVLTSPHGPSDVQDLGVSLQNRGLGLFTVQGKYDYPIPGGLTGTLAVGWFRSDVVNPVGGSNDMGTELANMFAYDFGGGLTLDLGASVLFTGDFYKTSPGAASPDNLWEAFSRVQLEF